MINTISFKFSLLGIFMSADIFGKFVIIALLATSIFSWAAIIFKITSFKKLNIDLNRFEKSFWNADSLSMFQKKSQNMESNPLMQIMRAGIKEYKESIHKVSNVVSISAKERIDKSMNIARNRSVDVIDSQLTLLATTGAITPFVGLLGTVWGIMNSFASIASTKNTSIAVVAPGISEALFATALGLFVAIPAVIFYNILSRKAELIVSRIDDFVLELQNILSRSIDEEKK